MKDQFSQFAQRTRRWKFEDGTTELLLAGILLSCGIGLQIQAHVWMGITFLGGVLLSAVLIETLKRKYVYPRAGYVEYRQTNRKGMWKPLTLSLLATIIWVTVFTWLLLRDAELALAWTMPILAGFIGLVLIVNAIPMHIPRLIWIGLISCALGFMISPLVIPDPLTRGLVDISTMSFYFLAMGLVLLVSGTCTFRNFLRQNPAPWDGAQ